MYPDKVRDIITTYMKDSRGGYWQSGWVVMLMDNTVDSKYIETHFFKICVYYDIKNDKTIVAFFPRYQEDMPTSNKWVQVSQGVITIDVTNMDTEEVYMEFHKFFEELNQVCLTIEYDENFPDNE
jgi:nitrate reductase alpha subunit